MFKYILETAGNINWMALFALITFFSVFTIAVVLVLGKSREFSNKMGRLPLEDDQPGIF